MNDRLRRIKLTPSAHRWVIVAAAAVWILLLLAGALPTWKRVRQNVRDLEAANDRLANLNDWSVAGAWMGEAARRREPALQTRYDRLFPADKGRDELFLELARVARLSGIEPLLLQEVPRHETTTGLEDEEMPEEDMAVEDLLDRFATDRSGLPGSELEAYRLKASFVADYGRLARFLDGLARIERALSLQQLRAEPLRGTVAVDLELDFYVQRVD